MAWVRNDLGTEEVKKDWLSCGVDEPGTDTGGLFIREYLNLATGARVVLLPDRGWKEAERSGHGEYQAWAISPGRQALRWTVWSKGERVKAGFGGTGASTAWSVVFDDMTKAIEAELGIVQSANSGSKASG